MNLLAALNALKTIRPTNSIKKLVSKPDTPSGGTVSDSQQYSMCPSDAIFSRSTNLAKANIGSAAAGLLVSTMILIAADSTWIWFVNSLNESPLALLDWLNALQHRKVISAKKLCYIRYDQDSLKNTTVYEETQTGRPHDTSVQKVARDNVNVDAV